MTQWSYHLTKQNWSVCELGTVLQFKRFWFQSLYSDLKSYRAFRETGPRKNSFVQTRTLLVALSLACLERSFVVSWLCYFFVGNTKRVLKCHNVNTQNVKIVRRHRPPAHLSPARDLSFTPVNWSLWKPYANWYCSNEENSFRDFTLKKLNDDFYQQKYITLLCRGPR